jgi:Ca2+-binding RTX toxin-like protein
VIPAVEIDNEGAASRIGVNLFDNILARSAGPAVLAYDTAGGPLHVRSGHNDLWANAGGNAVGTSAGRDTLHVNPQFVDSAHLDYRLRANSPVIDGGIVCSPGGVAMLDAGGHARLHGASVDLGALEHGSSAPTGEAVVGTAGGNTLNGTSGDDILCGQGGSDTLRGAGGNDYLDGGPGNDTVIGGAGNDVLFGGPGKDVLDGNAGNDRLCANDGTSGNDTANGGAGTDRAEVDPGDHRISIEGEAAGC